MTPRRLLTALITAATALALAPTAHADTPHQPSPDVGNFVISTLRTTWWGYVRDQTRDPGDPTVAWEHYGLPHQTWTIQGYTIMNVGTGLCATAVDGGIHGRPCGGSTAQQWSATTAGPDKALIIANRAYGTCATHQGGQRQILLKACDGSDVQLWYVTPFAPGTTK